MFARFEIDLGLGAEEAYLSIISLRY